MGFIYFTEGKKDFHGLNYSEMAQIGGVENIRNMGKICQRMKEAGDIKLYDKVYDKCMTKPKNCYILSENTEKELLELVENKFIEKLEDIKKNFEKFEFEEKLKNSLFDLKENLGDANSKVWEIIDQSIVLDFMKLVELNPTLTDLILDRPDQTLTLLEQNLTEEASGIFQNKGVRIKNLPKFQKKEIKKINTSDIGRLYSFDVEVTTSTQIYPATTLIKYECSGCGTIITINQNDGKFEVRGKKQEPKRCSCGRRGGFKELASDKVDYRIVLCGDNPENIEDNTPTRDKRFHFLGDIANIDEQYIQASSKLKIMGIPIIKETPQGEEIDIKAIWVEPNDELLVLNFSDEEIEEFKEFSKQNPLEKIKKETFDLSVSGHESVKQGLILQQVGGNAKKLNNGAYKRGDIHMLLIGDPATAKSQLASVQKKLGVRNAQADSNRGTSAGLTGTFEYNQQLGQKVRMGGLLDKAKGGLLIWEELNEADHSVQATLKTPLESSEYSVTLATGQLTKKSPFSFLATMNPKNGNYLNPELPVMQQIPLNPALKTRFDLIFGRFVKTNNRNEIEMILEKQDLNEDIPMERFYFFKKYLAYCKLQKTQIPKDIKDLLNGYVSALIISKKDANFRVKDTLNRLVEAFAKLNLREYANKEDFENAKKLFEDSLRSTSIKSGGLDWDRFIEVSSDDIKDQEELKSVFLKLTKDKEFCFEHELFENSKLRDARFKYILYSLLKKGEIDQDKIKKSKEAYHG